MSIIWSVLAHIMIALHFGFLAYLLFGGYLAWRWPRTLPLHVITAIWAALIITVKIQCPLTIAQNYFRHRQGLPSVPGGFIGNYVKGYLYPTHLETLSQIVVGVVVLASWIGLVVRHRRRTTVAVSGRHA